MQKKLYGGCLALVLSISAGAQVGYGTATPNSTLDVRGAAAFNIRSFTASTTATGSDYTLIYTGTTAVTVTMPDATGCAGRIYWLKDAGTGLPAPVMTVNGILSQAINGLPAWTLDETNEVVRMVSDGSGWRLSTQDMPVRKTATVGGAWNQGGNRITAIKNLGTITNNSLVFAVNDVQAARLSANGYLGLGTANPQGRLHLVTENDDSANDYYFSDYGAAISAAIFLRKIRGTVLAPQNLQSGDLIGQLRFAGRYNGNLSNSSGSGIDAYYLGTGTSNSTDMHLFTSNMERMLMNELGNTAIGGNGFSAAPEKLLVDAGNTASFNVISARGDIDNYLQLNMQNRSTGNTASTDVVATADNGDENTGFIDMGINSSGYTNSLIPILNGPTEAYLYSTGNNFVVGNGSPGYDMSMFTGSYSLTGERIRIGSSGNIAVGAFTPADKLSVAGILAPSVNSIYSAGTGASRWTEVWAANGTVQTSDARVKKDILPLEYGVKQMMQMEPVSYRWKNQPDGQRKIGLIAQRVRKLIPEVVVGEEEKEMLGINYPELLPVLIHTIQQQQQQLSRLRKELSTLEAMIK